MPWTSFTKVPFLCAFLFSLLLGKQALAAEQISKAQADTLPTHNNAGKTPMKPLQGHLSEDNLGALSSCQSFGFTCKREGATELPASVEIVAQNSIAFQRGLRESDRILKATASKTELDMVIERDNKIYALHLSSIPNTFGLRTPALDKAHPFSAAIIRQTGPNGVLQGRYPNCWFEAALAAVAAIPRGQQVISDMIVRNPDSTYSVLFRGDSAKAITLPQVEVITAGLSNPAPWANIIETAEQHEFPDNDAADDPNRGSPKIKTGLRILTGHEAQFCRPDSTGQADMEKIISNCIMNRIPIIIATKSPQEDGFLPIVLVPNHAYALINWDPMSRLVTLKNPLGDTFEKGLAIRRQDFMSQNPGQSIPVCPLPDVGAESNGVRNLGNGFVQVSIPTLQQYVRYMAWSPL